MGNGKALARPRVKDMRFGEPVVGELRNAIPGGAVPLAASSERAPPEVGHVLPERRERPAIGRNRIVHEVSSHDLPQPFPLFRDRLVHASPQLLLDLLEFCLHASRRVFL